MPGSNGSARRVVLCLVVGCAVAATAVSDARSQATDAASTGSQDLETCTNSATAPLSIGVPIYASLEQVQREMYASRGIVPLFCGDLRKREEEMRQFCRERLPIPDVDCDGMVAEVLSAQLPTRYEDPHGHWILKNLFDRVASAAAALGKPTRKSPAIATLPVLQPNAWSVNLGDVHPVILVPSQLFDFVNESVKLVARLMKVEEVSNGALRAELSRRVAAQMLREDPGIAERYREYLSWYFGAGSFPPVLVPSIQVLAVSARWTDAAELFVIGHEYAHLALRHKPLGSMPGVVQGGRAVTLQELLENWRQELAADSVGLEISYRANLIDGDEVDLKRWGPVLYLLCVESFERVRDDFSRARDGAGGDRRERLRDALIAAWKGQSPLGDPELVVSAEDVPWLSHPPPDLRRAMLVRTMRELGQIDPDDTFDESLEAAMEELLRAVRAHPKGRERTSKSSGP